MCSQAPFAFPILLMLTTVISGCAFKNTGDVRFALPGTEPWAEDLYSRNAVVAAPTLVGNVAGAAVGAVLALPIEGIERALGRRRETVAAAVLLVPIYVGGGITGTAFLPIAMMLPEHRWIMGPDPEDFRVRAVAIQRIEEATVRAENAAAAAEHYVQRANDAASRAEGAASAFDQNLAERSRPTAAGSAEPDHKSRSAAAAER